jgi:hypothetical protein
MQSAHIETAAVTTCVGITLSYGAFCRKPYLHHWLCRLGLNSCADAFAIARALTNKLQMRLAMNRSSMRDRRKLTFGFYQNPACQFF